MCVFDVGNIRWIFWFEISVLYKFTENQYDQTMQVLCNHLLNLPHWIIPLQHARLTLYNSLKCWSQQPYCFYKIGKKYNLHGKQYIWIWVFFYPIAFISNFGVYSARKEDRTNKHIWYWKYLYVGLINIMKEYKIHTMLWRLSV